MPGLLGCDCGHSNRQIKLQILTGRVTKMLALHKALLGSVNVGQRGWVWAGAAVCDGTEERQADRLLAGRDDGTQ